VVCGPGDEDLRDVGDCVGGDGHELGAEVGVAQASGDGGCEEGEGGEGDADAEVDEVVAVEAPVAEGGDGIMLGHAAVVGLGALDAKPGEGDFSVAALEVFLGVVGEEEPHEDGREAGRHAFDDKEPAPGREAACSVHVADGVCDGAAECAGEGGAGEDEGYANAALVGFVPEGEVVDQAGEQAGLEDTEEEADASRRGEALHAAQADGDAAPREHEESEPAGGAELLEEDVGGDFEDGIACIVSIFAC